MKAYDWPLHSKLQGLRVLAEAIEVSDNIKYDFKKVPSLPRWISFMPWVWERGASTPLWAWFATHIQPA